MPAANWPSPYATSPRRRGNTAGGAGGLGDGDPPFRTIDRGRAEDAAIVEHRDVGDLLALPGLDGSMRGSANGTHPTAAARMVRHSPATATQCLMPMVRPRLLARSVLSRLRQFQPPAPGGALCPEHAARSSGAGIRTEDRTMDHFTATFAHAIRTHSPNRSTLALTRLAHADRRTGNVRHPATAHHTGIARSSAP